jgi:hypothetical protein
MPTTINSLRSFIGTTLSCSLLLTGCYVPHIHDTDHFDEETGVKTLTVDAKQRVVTVARVPDKILKPDSPGTTTTVTKLADGSTKTKVEGGLVSVTCAEPSPDALTALSSSFGGGISDAKVAANFALAQTESAASIGLRTQSIQLLRDGMYRLCEGYAAGAIDGAEFNRQQRRYQNLMLSLLAIEQLTGAVAARQVALVGGTASASVGDKANEAAGTLAKANADLKTAQTTLKKAQDAQTKDEQDCKATPPDANACSKSASDSTSVDGAQSKLDQATEDQKTAQAAMLAARAAVKADASGAVPKFSDAPKTNQIDDGSARFIAEATRTIVTTTLIASNAQEDCSRLWDTLTGNATDSVKANVTRFFTGKGSPDPALNDFVGKTLTSEALTKLSDKATVNQGGRDLVSYMQENCLESQKTLLQQTALFTPQYGSVPAGPFQVLITGEGPVSLVIGANPLRLIVVGGVLPYHVSDISPDMANDISATLPTHPINGVFQLTLSRPEKASKTSGKATVYVVDSANTVVEVPVTLAGKPAAKPSEPLATDGGAKITGVSFADGKLMVKFTLPAALNKAALLANAVNTDNKKDALSAPGAAGATQIDIPGCTSGGKYDVSMDITPDGGAKSTIKYNKTVNCSAAAPIAGVPEPPTVTAATAQAGAKITVTFMAGAGDGGSAVKTFTAAATLVKGKGQQIKNSTPDGRVVPVELSGCTDGENYIVTVVANNANGASQPSKPVNTTCKK